MRPNRLRIRSFLCNSDVVDGDYALELTWEGIKYGGDAGVVQLEGGRLIEGIARYCNDGGPKRNNAIFTWKPDTKKVCGIKVLPGTEICNGEEIFVTYGKRYWKATQNVEIQKNRMENVIQ